ncbi:hypothetical protein MtrunA17_Chr8g0342111 [Medicago truncatula]|uniref:Uncharacterized protein n=1 Tax=Medicago truncatula TaxID=3880 RepID=A0A396GFN1_MEDTR|nr:hypothetical protein MtrunA17_Chr8g0342111 [Medicago truncatula]
MMSVLVIIEGSMNSSNPYFSSSWRRNFTVRVAQQFNLVFSQHYLVPYVKVSFFLSGKETSFLI